MVDTNFLLVLAALAFICLMTVMVRKIIPLHMRISRLKRELEKCSQQRDRLIALNEKMIAYSEKVVKVTALVEKETVETRKALEAEQKENHYLRSKLDGAQ